MKIIKTIPKLKPRAIDAHKGDFGKVCIIAGNIGSSRIASLAYHKYKAKLFADLSLEPKATG